ncbi:alpha/beta hydrolase [Phenylobacterium immobile]|uniref:alpha/beta hydrolase n=1 Tax=Phenylobacterium immobile TaxID=21 RepID=UPI000B30858F|nr:alpha/beta hydrolase [Phenylobacterium immobile]
MRLSPILAACAATLAAACAPLTLFATLAPKDPAAVVERGTAYGSDPRQRLDVYAPKRRMKAAPMAVFFYGGGWDSGRRKDYGWVGHALAAQGFVTIVADYRVYPQVRYPGFLEDGAQAVRWAVDHGPAIGGDPTRIVLIGHSSGAYNAVMLALDPRFLRAAGVDPGAIRAVAGLAGPYDFLPLEGPITSRTFGHVADLEATQPMTFARTGAVASLPPAFLATGSEDKVVYPRNTHALAGVLRARGVPVEEKTYEGLDHPRLVLALSRPLRKRAPVLADMTAFLRAQTVR